MARPTDGRYTQPMNSTSNSGEDTLATDTQALFDPIDKAVTAALHDNHIYPISSYGWLDAYTADPKMIGHAMWQTEPPFEFSYGTESEQSEPTEYQRYLTILGADFEGLMELACNSLGIVLWRQNETIVDHFGDSANFGRTTPGHC